MANELLKAQIEAALFLTDKPLKAQAVARIVNSDVDLVRQMIIELIHDYETRNGGLEVADDDGYIIQVKDEYTHFVDEFVPIDMPTALIRTLSAIALKQPVLQSEIVKIRGAGAYEHIKELIERELINKREEGRSAILTTTKKFQEYFRLSKDGKSLRQQLSEDGLEEQADGSTNELAEAVSASEETANVTGREATAAAFETEIAATGSPVVTIEDSVATTEAMVATTKAELAAHGTEVTTTETNVPITEAAVTAQAVHATAMSEGKLQDSETASSAIDAVNKATDNLLSEVIEEASVFDASPDPDTAPIGMAGTNAPAQEKMSTGLRAEMSAISQAEVSEISQTEVNAVSQAEVHTDSQAEVHTASQADMSADSQAEMSTDSPTETYAASQHDKDVKEITLPVSIDTTGSD